MTTETPTDPLWAEADSHLFDPIATNMNGAADVYIPTLRELRRQNRAAATARAELIQLADLDSHWRPGDLLTLITYRYFSIYRAIIFWARKYGPGRLTACTWALSAQAATELRAEMPHPLTGVDLLVDFHTYQNRAEGLGILTTLPSVNIGTTRQHAKVSVLSAARPLTIISTANLNENQRIEVTLLSDDPDDADFHRRWILEEIQRTRTLMRPDQTIDPRRWRFNQAPTEIIRRSGDQRSARRHSQTRAKKPGQTKNA